ncbi:MAG: flagellar biosynthesis repressor FlbT [Pseudomonadota bacterium]
MSGLVIKLRPAERLMINGVVIENGDRRSRFNILTPDANVLRLKDAIHPDDATTPVKRVCYIAQLILAGETDRSEARTQLLRGVEQLSQVFTDADSRTQLATATDHLIAERYYPALKSLRALLPREDRLLASGGG